MKIAVLVTATLLLTTAGAFAGSDGDAEKGKRVFKKCSACHMVGDNAKRKVGPVLNDIYGATAGTNEDFGRKYSKAMKKAGEDGLVWDKATLAEFLTKPKAMIKKTKMSMKGIKEKDMPNILAYLLTFSPNYKPADAETDG